MGLAVLFAIVVADPKAQDELIAFASVGADGLGDPVERDARQARDRVFTVLAGVVVANEQKVAVRRLSVGDVLRIFRKAADSAVNDETVHDLDLLLEARLPRAPSSTARARCHKPCP